MQDVYPLYLAGRAHHIGDTLKVTDKYAGAVVAQVARAGAAELDRAIAAAADAADAMRRMKGYQRQAVLRHLVQRCEQRKEELAQMLCAEAGKPIRFARGEVDRLIDTLRIAMEEAPRCLAGEVLPLDVSERAANYQGMWKRVPIGPCAFITPWNFPLNLVAHKIGPALACGCPFVLKPASATPLGALVLGEMLAETDLPEGAFSILPMNAGDADALVQDDRIRKLSFTGSTSVGWQLKAKAGRKRVTLELGGNAGVIIDETMTETDLDDAADRAVFGAFYQSGQSCIAVQRIYAHDAIYERFREKLVAKAQAVKAGDPHDEQTFVGPMITQDDAERVEQWVTEAVRAGAVLLCGGERTGAVYSATLLEAVPQDARVNREEVFGPVATLARFSDFDHAMQQVNDSCYGLQAGVFTRDLHRMNRAWEELRVGGVMINEVPSWRVDHMPYGGAAGTDSGLGREGVRFAIDSMTEPRLLVMRTPDHV